jgi:predicted transcriptional regulator
MSKPLISVRVPNDLKEEFDEYADQRGISKSVAMRRLLWAGLEAKTESEEEQSGGAGGMLERIASLRTVTHAAAFLLVTALSWGMVVLLPTAGTATVVLLAATGGVTLLLAALTMLAAALAQIALNRPLTGLLSRGDMADV